MAALMEWIRQIAFFLIFMTLFYHLVPQAKYQKYIRFFASLVLVILTVSPLLKLFDMEEDLRFHREVFAYPQEVEEFQLRAEQLKGRQYAEILEAYGQSVEEHLRWMAEQAGLYTVNCKAQLSSEEETFGQVTAVDMTVTYRRLSKETESQADGGIAPVVVKVEMETETAPSPQQQPETKGEENKRAADIVELEEKIMALYQLGETQVTVSLKE